jgi:phage gpG-like protein
MDFIVTANADSLIAKMDGNPAALRRALLPVINKLSIEVQTSVKQDKLTGQVLHVRTGTLRRSINREVKEQQDGIFATIGTNIKYGIAWENGFEGDVKVAAHTRRQRERLTYAQQYLKSGKIRIGKLTGQTAEVQAHMRHINMPARPFLKSALKDFTPRIKEELRVAVLGVLR